MAVTISGATVSGGITLGDIVAPVTSGLVLSLDAGNTSSYSGSGTTWTDLSGNGNNGTLYNTPTYVSGSAGYIGFNGSNQYMQANIGTTSLNGDPSCTIEFVAQIPQNFVTAGFWGLGGAGQGLSFEGWAPTTNRIHWDVYDSTRLDTGIDYLLNTWYHVVWTKDGAGVETTNVKNYVNNVQSTLTKTRDRTSGPALNTSTPGVGAVLGRINGNADAYYAAVRIGVYRIYNRALSSSEVYQNFMSIKSRYGL